MLVHDLGGGEGNTDALPCRLEPGSQAGVAPPPSPLDELSHDHTFNQSSPGPLRNCHAACCLCRCVCRCVPCTEPKPQAIGAATPSSSTTPTIGTGAPEGAGAPRSSHAKYLGCYKDRRAGGRAFPSRTWMASMTLDKCMQLARAPCGTCGTASRMLDRKTIRKATGTREPSRLIGLQNGEQAT